MNVHLLAGIRRRLFRRYIISHWPRRAGKRDSGKAVLSGYGLTMEYPDRLIWLNQIRDIVAHDCYGAHALPPIPHVLDIGANIGTFSLFVKWLRPAAVIASVEPAPQNISFLRRNMEANSCNDIRVIAAAIGRPGRDMRISGSVSDSIRTGDQGEPVAVMPLSELITAPVDLLKIDVEGAEIDVLESGSSSLALVSRMIIEYHLYPNEPGHVGRLIALAEESGFNRFRIYDPRPIVSEDPRLPVFCCLIEASRGT